MSAAEDVAEKVTKVVVHLRAGPGTPILKTTKFRIEADTSFGAVHRFLRKQLRCQPHDNLFVYCNAAFCPNPDQRIGDLFECFKVNNELQVNYCTADAWG